MQKNSTLGRDPNTHVRAHCVQVPSMEKQVMASLLLSCQGLCEPGERLIFKLSVLGHHTFCPGRSTGWKAALLSTTRWEEFPVVGVSEEEPP